MYHNLHDTKIRTKVKSLKVKNVLRQKLSTSHFLYVEDGDPMTIQYCAERRRKPVVLVKDEAVIVIFMLYVHAPSTTQYSRPIVMIRSHNARQQENSTRTQSKQHGNWNEAWNLLNDMNLTESVHLALSSHFVAVITGFQNTHKCELETRTNVFSKQSQTCCWHFSWLIEKHQQAHIALSSVFCFATSFIDTSTGTEQLPYQWGHH